MTLSKFLLTFIDNLT
jgi:hypothetical protein